MCSTLRVKRENVRFVLIGTLHEDLQSFNQVTSVDELTAVLRVCAERFGFEWFVYALKTCAGSQGPRLALVNGYPDPWIEHYFERGLLAQDPIMRHCRTNFVPIRWERLHTDDPDEQLVMNSASEFGLRNGVSAPLYGPNGELGVLSFATGADTSETTQRLDQVFPYTPILAGYVHQTLRRILADEGERLLRPLSARERECLLWVAQGKTSWEIGVILSVSERTVHFHLGNTCRKLGVTNRQHAVAKALLLGLLDSPAPVRFDR